MEWREVWPERFPGEPPRRGIGWLRVVAVVLLSVTGGVLGAIGTVEWRDRSEQAASTDLRARALRTQIDELETHAKELRNNIERLAEMEGDALASLQTAQSEQAVVEELQRELERELERAAVAAWTTTAAPTATPTTTTTLHPRVVSDAEAAVVGVVEQYSDAWPWLDTAWEASQVTFFEHLPRPCAGAAGCVRDASVWLTLDAVLSGDTVLHELGHVWNNLVPPTGFDERGRVPWPLVQVMFYEHYAGCYSSRADADRLREELLVDAMVLAVDPSKAPLWGGYGYYEEEDLPDFWSDAGFSGCLVDSGEPPEHLTEAIFAALYNCEAMRKPERGGQGPVSTWQRMAKRLAVSVCQDFEQESEAT